MCVIYYAEPAAGSIRFIHINTSTVKLMKGLGTRDHPLKSPKKISKYDCDRLHHQQ